MNHQAAQYRSLTSSIKTWMSECKSPSRNAILCSIISHTYGQQERPPQNDTLTVASPEMDAITENPTNQPAKFSVTKTQLQSVEVKLCNHCNLQKPNWYLNTSTPKRQCKTICELNTSAQTTCTSESELSYKTANESVSVDEDRQKSPRNIPKRAPERNYEKYPESIRHKIKFFETGATPRGRKVVFNVKTVASKRDSSQNQEIIQECHAMPCGEAKKEVASKPEISAKEEFQQTSFQRKPPVITEMVLKQQVVDQLKAIHEQAELRDEIKELDAGCKSEPTQDNSRISGPALPFEEHARNCEQNSSFSPKKNGDDEKFIVNLYERRSSKKWPRVKSAVTGSLVKVSSKLYIRDVPTTEEADVNKSSSDDTVTPDTTSSGETVIPKNSNLPVNCHSDKPAADLDATSVSRSTISALLDSSASISESSVNDSNESVASATGLLEEVHNQCRIMQQATKAVEMCSTVKELAYGEEQLEAERILLLAGLKRNLLLSQMREAEYGGASKSQFSSGGARLTISDIEFPLMLPEDHQDYKIWYIVTCTCESILKASQLIQLRRHCHFLNITGSFVFENVHPYSVVNLKVYQVKVRNNPNDRRRINKLCCFAPINSCVRRSQKVQYKDLYSGTVVQREVLPSIFTLCGSLDITMDLLLNNKNFLLNTTPNDSTLFGSLKLTSRVSNISMNQTHFGFLTVGTEQNGCTTWGRSWCRLEGTTMRFWDNPSEEGLNPPKTVVELKNCMEDEVKVADKNFCRRHILTLDIAGVDGQDNLNLVVTKYFLTTDTTTDLKIWKKRLNSVLTSLRLWKSLGEHFDV